MTNKRGAERRRRGIHPPTLDALVKARAALARPIRAAGRRAAGSRSALAEFRRRTFGRGEH